LDKGKKMSYRILIIEDDPGWQETFELILVEMGHGVERVNTFDKAKEALAARKYNLIISDLCLGGDIFTDACQKFNSWLVENYAKIPLIITSGQELPKSALTNLGQRMSDRSVFIDKAKFIVEDFRNQVTRSLAIFNDIRILHLSDIHLNSKNEAKKYKMQLEIDLKRNLHADHLDFIVFTGDIANRSLPEEYEAAVEMVSEILASFHMEASQLIMVPGNHDLNWEFAEKSYEFIYNTRKNNRINESFTIPAGEYGFLQRNEKTYKERFQHFNKYFYEKLLNVSYPSDYAEQGQVFFFQEHKILFLTLNTAWEVDFHYKDRASICMESLNFAFQKITDSKYEDWLKIAVWHHPVTGLQMMKDDSLQLLSANGFQIILHGHVHEALSSFYTYDKQHEIRIIGAGTFGAPANDQVTGIPLQYNLLTLNFQQGMMKVETRKKEKADGAWMADARWGNRNNPKASYKFRLR
jgi:predicted MPP superfamily phosphohydrolase